MEGEKELILGNLAELQEYLSYMSQLGFMGLALDENPFLARPQAPAKPKLVVSRKKTVPSKPSGPNLFEIMESVNLAMPEEDTRARVEAITGESKIEVLRNLYKTFRSCHACALGTTRRKFVFGEGNHEAKLMFVGEGPGQDEDITGRPFVGQAGQLLTRIIEAMGLKRTDVFIANVVKCRPPQNRKPLPDEIASCSPILLRQIETVAPQVIVALGATALSFFKGGNVSIQRTRGEIFEWRGMRVIPTYHPAYILRNPRAKRDVWEDMKKAMEMLNG